LVTRVKWETFGKVRNGAGPVGAFTLQWRFAAESYACCGAKSQVETPGRHLAWVDGNPSRSTAKAGEETMDEKIRKFFERYEKTFNKSLAGREDLNETAALYATEFVAASPAGVMAGKNDDQLKKVMAEGYQRYRAMGTKEMRIRNIRVSPIDEHHCLAHVAWTATYARKDQEDIAIDFDVHYFVRDLGGDPKVFGWVSGDEQASLREHGII
jgi:hypothetical protein